MKKIIQIAFIGMLSCSISGFTSCNNNKEKTIEDVETGKEYTSAFICPMHCEGSGSDSTGICPVCGMDYIKNEDYKSDDHTHDDGHDHDGHDHDHEGHNH